MIKKCLVLSILGHIIFFALFYINYPRGLSSVEESAAGVETREGKTRVLVEATAYYAPKPRQKSYATGSYHRDIRLNGKGKFTFTGKRPKLGIVAADPDIFPFGTWLRIPGYGVAVVEDVGSAIKGARIDVFMGEGQHGLARSKAWGKRQVVVEVLGSS